MRRILISLAILCGIAGAQTSTLDQANTALGASDFTKAATLFKQVTDADASNGAAWEGLGNATLKTGDFDVAESAFNHAVTLQWRPYLNQLNIARVAAKRGQGDRAIRLLSELAATGRAGQLRPYLLSSEFAPLQSSAEFQKVKEAFLPCRAPEFREFDFWVGEWKVENPAGQPVGTNSVTLEQDGCLLVEHWKSGRGFETGTSFNYYDIRDKKWHQLYIANNGNAGAFPAMAGGLADGKMVLLTDVDASGKQQRWTWYVISPGKVRQMAEQTTDGGKTWTPTWDSVYVASH
jgi:tetratricopeptide (TPR) repeat protein